ncbi:hypothetical protein PIB30_003273 [Stylosanthes scabra]|uniref:Uncharacterized protein n=1 Tax=Stylosanthes scabra TaxID=79078 RepID=A0ABU6S381_9FABA|nr:hypothetical protein [Stylosanthes scabra]
MDPLPTEEAKATLTAFSSISREEIFEWWFPFRCLPAVGVVNQATGFGDIRRRFWLLEDDNGDCHQGVLLEESVRGDDEANGRRSVGFAVRSDEVDVKRFDLRRDDGGCGIQRPDLALWFQHSDDLTKLRSSHRPPFCIRQWLKLFRGCWCLDLAEVDVDVAGGGKTGGETGEATVGGGVWRWCLGVDELSGRKEMSVNGRLCQAETVTRRCTAIRA